jgi:hypothetical protein
VKKLLVVLLALGTSNCSAARKPDISFCTLDATQLVAYCAKTVPPYINYKVNLDVLDNAIMVSPDDWAKIKTYVDELEFENKSCR